MNSNHEELARTVTLLNEVFAVDPPYSLEGLSWYYRDNPVGCAAVGAVDDGDIRTGNYSLVPQVFRDGSGKTVVLGLGVDLAVLPAARRAGTFRRTVEDAYLQGERAGMDSIIGVANANSAPRMESALGWRTLAPLPVTLVLPSFSRTRLESHRVTGEFLRSPRFDALAEGGFLPPSRSSGYFEPEWTGDYLRWRLARPGAQYSLHVNEDLVVVSTLTRMMRLPFALVLKVLARRPLEAPVSLGGIARAMIAHHRTPLVVHWGKNPMLRVRGIRLPQEKMPSPLTIVMHGLKPAFDEAGFELGSFEFLDFDAY